MGQMLLQVMDESEIARLHGKTLEILAKAGIRIAHAEARAKLQAAGARVQDANELVFFPPELVAELLRSAPSWVMHQELSGKSHHPDASNRMFNAIVTDPFIIDYTEGKRPPRLDDVRKHTIVAQSLERVGGLMRMQQPVSDVPEPFCYLKTMEVFMSHHNKHTWIMPTDMENCRLWLELLDVISEAYGITAGAPIASIAAAVTSPLQLHGLNIELIKTAIAQKYPLVSTVCPMAGTTAPYSVAGTALLANVEALLPILITQLYQPGHPIYYMTGPSVVDMKNGHDLYYKAEKMKFKIIACQMGRFYGLPLAGETGGSLTHRLDIQNGAECFSYMLASLANGQNMFGGLGSLGNANAMSAEMMVIQDALLAMAEYAAAGVDCSEEKWASEAICRVGAGGNYLMDDSTLKWLRGKEFFETPLFDLTGGYLDNPLSIAQKAHAKVEEILHQFVNPVPEKVQEAIRQFTARRTS